MGKNVSRELPDVTLSVWDFVWYTWRLSDKSDKNDPEDRLQIDHMEKDHSFRIRRFRSIESFLSKSLRNHSNRIYIERRDDNTAYTRYKFIMTALCRPRIQRRRYAEAELQINNLCYKAFRYGDIDYVH